MKSLEIFWKKISAILNALAHSSNGCSGQSCTWADARSLELLLGLKHGWPGHQALGPSYAAFPCGSTGSWMGIGDVGAQSKSLYDPLCRNVSPFLLFLISLIFA